MKGGLKDTVEYFAARALLEIFGRMPRRAANRAAEMVAWLGFRLARRQRGAGLRNLQIAFPQLDRDRHLSILRGSFRNLGRLLVEFSHFPDLNEENISQFVVYDGFEHFENAKKLGKGVIFLTAHIGAWELSSFAHSIYGNAMKFVVRQIDNRRVEELIASYRGLWGNVAILRQNAAREILKALRANETVGILVDQNTTDSEGVFVNFFGIPAATTNAVATLALRTGAPVIPGFLIWDKLEQRHRLQFDPPVTLIQTGDRARDIIENTQLFNEIVERYVREYPDQWLWIHRRWKTRPRGDPPLY